jgi:hypothetical protein
VPPPHPPPPRPLAGVQMPSGGGGGIPLPLTPTLVLPSPSRRSVPLLLFLSGSAEVSKSEKGRHLIGQKSVTNASHWMA